MKELVGRIGVHLLGKTRNKNVICNNFFIDGMKEENETKIANPFCEYFTNAAKNLQAKFLAVSSGQTESSWFNVSVLL